ncbi:unnamed protein product [Euphydryas editha]|uniref:Uncharacterized protein n=1 Tax=Euphydryas editha TaxID=104508 RepID=A0AAU9TVG7_EUPED|nr:unnamed protein product [Euphydryas editha]
MKWRLDNKDVIIQGQGKMNVFDVFNSRNLKAHSYKHPLFPGNKTEVFSVLEEAEDLILNLNIKVSRKTTYKERQNQETVSQHQHFDVSSSRLNDLDEDESEAYTENLEENGNLMSRMLDNS